MTPELTALLRACKEEPTDDLPRRALADWLEEHGQAERAEFVRLQLRHRGDRYEDGMPWSADTAARKARELRLLRKHAGDWLGGTYTHWRWCDVPAGADTPTSVRLSRGLAYVQTAEEAFAALVRGWPEQMVPWLETFSPSHIIDKADWRELVQGPYLEPFSDLSVCCGRASSAPVIGLLERSRPAALRLTESPSTKLLQAVAGLPWFRPRCLTIYLERTSLEGWEALAGSGVMSEVRFLDCHFPSQIAPLSVLASSGHLGNLHDLRLTGNGIDPTSLQQLLRSERLAELTDLDLSDESGLGPRALAALANSPSIRCLERLRLESYQLSDDGVAALARSPVLDGVRELELSRGIGVAAARALAASPHLHALTSLDVAGNQIGDEGVIALADSQHLTQLSHLDLRGCGLTDASMVALAKSPHLAGLESLDVGGNDLTGAALAALAASTTLSNLKSLRLPSLSTPGAGFRSLLSQLRSLRLPSLPTPGIGFQSLVRSPVVANLVRLDLGSLAIGHAEVEAMAGSPYLTNLRELTLLDPDKKSIKALAEAPWLDGLIQLKLLGGSIDPAGMRALTGALRSGTLAELTFLFNLDPAAARILLEWPGLAEVVELSLTSNEISEELHGEIQRVVRHL